MSLKAAGWVANSVDPNQNLHSVMSEPCLHFCSGLTVSILRVHVYTVKNFFSTKKLMIFFSYFTTMCVFMEKKHFLDTLPIITGCMLNMPWYSFKPCATRINLPLPSRSQPPPSTENPQVPSHPLKNISAVSMSLKDTKPPIF